MKTAELYEDDTMKLSSSSSSSASLWGEEEEGEETWHGLKNT